MLWMGACGVLVMWRLDLRPLIGLISKIQESLPSPTSPPPTPAPSSEQFCDDSTFNVLQLNAKGIGNKQTGLGVVQERNKVKVAVIQKSKLSLKSKNPCIRYYTTVLKGHAGGLLIFIHWSITFSKQPSSRESLFDPHLEELTIKADIGNTKLIISNIYIPPASCTGYQSLIEHILTTPLWLFNRTSSVMSIYTGYSWWTASPNRLCVCPLQ